LPSTEANTNEDETTKVNLIQYYDQNLARFKFVGLTKEYFLILAMAKEPYLRLKKIFPGLSLPIENLACFATGEYTVALLSTLDRELIRLSSSLHKEKYLPSGGTGIPYQVPTFSTTTHNPSQLMSNIPQSALPPQQSRGQTDQEIWSMIDEG
jgi:hypothetical protein